MTHLVRIFLLEPLYSNEKKEIYRDLDEISSVKGNRVVPFWGIVNTKHNRLKNEHNMFNTTIILISKSRMLITSR